MELPADNGVLRIEGDISTDEQIRMKDSELRARPGDAFAGPYGEIPKRLKEYYDSLNEEAIPERFLELLEKLDRAEQAAQRADMPSESR
jgi:Anti-sigma factor NepR